MKVFTIDQIKQIQNEQNYKYIGLFNQMGQALIPINSNKTTPAQRMREIETRLLSEALPDGYYFIKCKNSTVKNAQTDDYAIMKGEKLSEAAPIQIVEKPVFQPEVLTYEGALKLQIELERYKLENSALKKEIQNLEDELAEKETLSEAPEKTTLDTAKDWLTEILAIGAPLLDKHFVLKEQQLQLRAAELKILNSQKPQAPMQKPENSIKEDSNKQSIEDIIMTFQSEPETYNKLANCYNEAASIEDFLHKVEELDPELRNIFA